MVGLKGSTSGLINKLIEIIVHASFGASLDKQKCVFAVHLRHPTSQPHLSWVLRARGPQHASPVGRCVVKP